MNPIPSKIIGLLSVLAGFAFFYVWRTGPLQGYDTVSYLDYAANREPLYPLLLNFSRFVFGSKADSFLMLFQTASVLAASVYLSRILYAMYRLPPWGLVLCFCVTASPLFLLKTGNYLLSEAIAYPVFLFSVSLVAKAVHVKTPRALFSALAVIMLSTLTRPQMSVMYLMWAGAAVYLFCLKKTWKRVVLFSCVLGTAFTFGTLIKCFYHAHYNGVFQGTKSGWIYLAGGALYISNSGDLGLFRGEKYFPLMASIYEQMDKDRLFSLYRHDSDQNMAAYLSSAKSKDRPYLYRMVVIYWYILVKKTYLYLENGDASAKWEDDLNGVVRKKAFNADGKRWAEMNAICADIFKKIVANRYKEYLGFQGSILRYHFNLIEACFYGFLCLLFLLEYTEINVLISIFTVFNLVHLVFIGTSGAYEPRMCFYSYVLQVVCLLLLAAQYRVKRVV